MDKSLIYFFCRSIRYSLKKKRIKIHLHQEAMTNRSYSEKMTSVFIQTKLIGWEEIIIITVSCITAKKRYHGPKGFIPVDVALKKFFSCIDFSEFSCPIENVSLVDAGNRVLANDLSSEMDIPPFVRADMDGYAIKSADTKGASTKNPILLQVVGK
jgi:hypothetical protein